MYLVRLSHDVAPVNREQAIALIQREFAAAPRRSSSVPLTFRAGWGYWGSAISTPRQGKPSHPPSSV